LNPNNVTRDESKIGPYSPRNSPLTIKYKKYNKNVVNAFFAFHTLATVLSTKYNLFRN